MARGRILSLWQRCTMVEETQINAQNCTCSSCSFHSSILNGRISDHRRLRRESRARDGRRHRRRPTTTAKRRGGLFDHRHARHFAASTARPAIAHPLRAAPMPPRIAARLATAAAAFSIAVTAPAAATAYRTCAACPSTGARRSRACRLAARTAAASATDAGGFSIAAIARLRSPAPAAARRTCAARRPTRARAR